VIASGETVDGRDFYPPDTLRRAAEKFDGVQCFTDHPDSVVGSVTRLAGWLSDPKLVETDGRVEIHEVLHVLASSEASALLREIYQRNALHTVGLSINARGQVHFENRNGRMVRVIDEIEAVDSVDIVTKPNAGGAILRLRAAVSEAADALSVNVFDIQRLQELLAKLEAELSEPAVEPAVATEEAEVAKVSKKEEEVEIEALKKEIEELKKALTAEQAQREIEAAIKEAALPEPLEKSARSRLLNVTDVRTARAILQEVKDAWALATEAAKLSTPTLHAVEQPKRKILRLQAMLAGEPIEGVEPYISLRDAYGDITGRSDVFRMANNELASELIRASQGFDSARIRETIETSDWSYALGQAIHRELIRQYKMPAYDEWRLVCSRIGAVPDMRTQDRLRFSYFNLLPEVGENGTYQPASDPSEQRAYFTPSKYGMLVSWTWESALNDDLNALREIPRRLALSAKVTVWYNVLSIFTSATPPTCTYDGAALFSADRGNLVTDDLSVTTFGEARAWMREMTAYGSNYAYLGASPKYLLVPPENERMARTLRNSEYLVEGSSLVENPWAGSFEIIVVPFWSDEDAWAVVADPQNIPTIEVAFLGGREEPELFTEAPNTGSGFTADKVTYKIRHVWGYCILDHRGMYKSTGAS